MRLKEMDHGTPPSAATQNVRALINGQSVEVPEGTSIMRAASEAGVAIPKLCATDHLNAFGSCRLCLVEIEGRESSPRARPCAARSCRLQHELGRDESPKTPPLLRQPGSSNPQPLPPTLLIRPPRR